VSGPSRVIVTGGTGALGRAVVKALRAAGARVAVPYQSTSGEDELRAAGPEVKGWRADLSDPAAARGFVAEAVAWLGGLDGLALLAGAFAGGQPFEKAPENEWDRMMRANLATLEATCRAALPHLLKQGGAVVTVGSRAAETGGSGMAAYAVSKVAVSALTRVLALENRERGVRFNCVLPGTIDTPANRKAMPKADTSGWTSPDALARVIVFLLSSESAATSGALVPVDGRA
jgi:NAD(P)-dependent dehydrogenase (short-subunit alcohol dehydrogenase family)